MTRTLLYIDQAFLHTVRGHLHMYKKCFQGRDFVSAVTMLGGKVQSPVLQPASGRHTEAIPVARSTVYTEQYAADLGHHLLQQVALIEVFQGDHTSHVPPRNEGAALEGSVISTSLVRGGALNTARMVEDSATQVVPTSLQGPQPTHGTAWFTNEAWYKFADVEDSDSRALYASQVLTASSTPVVSSDTDFSQDMDRARSGSLFLVCDLLLQRSRERAVKQFLQTPSVRNVLEDRRTENTSCDYIFKL